MTLLINAREFLKRLGSWDKKKCLHAVNKAYPCELWRIPMIIRAIWVKIRLNLSTKATSGPGGWDTTHMKGVGMLVVLLRGGGDVGFWSHLGCSWAKRHHYSAVKVSFRVAREKIWKYIFDMDISNAFYLLHSYSPSFLNCLCFIMISLRGQKELGPRPDRSPLGV